MVSLLDKKKYKHRIIYLILTLILLYFTFNNILKTIYIYPNLNITVIPLTVVGIMSFVLTKNKDYDIFVYFIFLGIFCSFLFQFSSNLGLPAIGTAYSIVTVGSIILIGNLIDELGFNNISTYILLICIGIQFCYQGYIRYDRYYLDNVMATLNSKIEVGPAKGIITNSTDCETYTLHYEQFQMLLYDATKEDVFYYPYSNPWYYLATNMQIGTYSTWGSWGDPVGTNKINQEYFKQKPYKQPTYVLLNKNHDIQLYELIENLNKKGYKKGKLMILSYILSKCHINDIIL